MIRYFLEVAYKGTKYSGFQVQENAITVQSEIERALEILLRSGVRLTGSSRTDSGVHALQNYFHFDTEEEISERKLYNINSLLPDDIVVKCLHKMKPKNNGALPHARFDATSRKYKYFILQRKDPFKKDTSFYFPYKLDFELLQQAALVIKAYTDFTSFSKRNTQVKTYNCSILESEWKIENEMFIYHVRSNRFLRGMVRALVGTMLQVGRKKISIDKFHEIINARDCSLADFSAPAQGLFLITVEFPEDFFSVKSAPDEHF
ncbi:MAG TPA: tRNA pseudouridine(38-40) synthase TruA [Chitinophagaceae bacterium]|nr:tRNA pseudouridine(38-40) synthase TruA [Chitinophagaceae bacterium]